MNLKDTLLLYANDKEKYEGSFSRCEQILFWGPFKCIFSETFRDPWTSSTVTAPSGAIGLLDIYLERDSNEQEGKYNQRKIIEGGINMRKKKSPSSSHNLKCL